MAGQVSGIVKSIRTVKEVLDEMFLDVDKFRKDLKIL